MKVPIEELIEKFGNRFPDFVGRQVMLKSFDQIASENRVDEDGDIRVTRETRTGDDFVSYIFRNTRHQFGRPIYVSVKTETGTWIEGGFYGGFLSPEDTDVYIPFEAVDLDFFILDGECDEEVIPPDGDLFGSLL